MKDQPFPGIKKSLDMRKEKSQIIMDIHVMFYERSK